MRRSIGGWFLLACVCVSGATSNASEDSAADDVMLRAERVAQAVAAKDAETLQRLGSDLRLDPWQVAEMLLLRGEASAADTFAGVSKHAAVRGLDAYVRDKQAVPPPATLKMVLDLMSEAQACDAAGELAASIDLYARAEKQLARPGRILGLTLRLDRGRVLAMAGRKADARRVLQKAQAEAEELGWLRGVADALNGLAITAQDPPEREALATCYEQESALRVETGDDVGAGKAFSNLAVVHAMFGDYVSALPALEQATMRFPVTAEDPANGYNHGHLLWTKGGIQVRVGESARAAATLQQALRLMRAYGSEAEVAEILASLGDAHLYLADYDGALRYQTRLEALQRKRADLLGIAMALRLRGQIERDLGDPAIAHEKLLEARARFEELKEARWVTYTNLDIADLLALEGTHDEALKTYRGVLAYVMAQEGTPYASYVKARMGESLLTLGKAVEAASMHGEGLALARRWGDVGDAVRNLTGLGRVALERGEFAAAIRYSREAVEELPALIRGATLSQAPAARASRSAAFDIGQRAALEANDTASLAYFLESGRAGALLEALGWRAASHERTLPAGLRERSRELRRRRAVAEAALVRARRFERRRTELKELRKRLGEADKRLRAFTNDAQLEARFATTMLYPRARSLEEIRRALESDEAIVLFRVQARDAFALVIAGSGSTMVRQVRLGPTKALRLACDALLRAIANEEPDLTQRVADLRRMAFDPLRLPATGTRAYVSPDGPLAEVPPSLLMPGRDVTLVPSATALMTWWGALRPAGHQALAVGDPVYPRGARLARLPSSAGEVLAVPKPAVRLLRERATVPHVERVLREHARWRVVHFACHGILREDPWMSALALTPSRDRSGTLTALDIAGLSLDADLVILSACDSAKGVHVRGEGLIGLTHGFLCAGAQRVLAGLWKVDDEATAALMKAFHRAWKGGSVRVSTALRQAQDEVRKNPRWTHPYYWAAWVPWGDPR